MTHALFEPITLRGLEVRNRLWVAPMCQYSVDERDGIATAWHLVHLGGFARSGAGAVVAEATAVLPEGRITPEDLGPWNDQQRDALRPIVDFIHSQGAAAGIQLAHSGRKGATFRPWLDRPGTVPVAEGGWSTVGPSAIAFPGHSTPAPLDLEGIRDVIAAFAAAAARAVAAGFDILEIHAAHGYLLHQFLSPLSNQRDDLYGGSLENRARLLMDVIDAIRGEIPDTVPLIVRFSATDWVEGGWTLSDTETVAGWAAAHGADLIDLSSGGSSPEQVIPVGPGYQVPFATAVRQTVGVPSIAAGMIDGAFHPTVAGQMQILRTLVRHLAESKA